MYFQICIGKCGGTGSPYWSLLMSCPTHLFGKCKYLNNVDTHKHPYTQAMQKYFLSEEMSIEWLRHNNIRSLHTALSFYFLEKYTKWKDVRIPCSSPTHFLLPATVLGRNEKEKVKSKLHQPLVTNLWQDKQLGSSSREPRLTHKQWLSKQAQSSSRGLKHLSYEHRLSVFGLLNPENRHLQGDIAAASSKGATRERDYWQEHGVIG